MRKFLYLTQHAFQDAWINGGEIPIMPASTYLSDVRNGTSTPDENLIHKSKHDLTKFPLLDLSAPNAFLLNATIIGCSFDGIRVPDIVKANYYTEDGAILSFCHEKNAEIMNRLGKVCCVRILDVERLKSVIDLQLGIKGKMGSCKYTKDHQRSHFLKSNMDAWQQEYRLFWKNVGKTFITLPPGIGEAVQF
ncbi:hypothetical protein [Janthinobacterium sp. HLX7-2]|uniref:hypothetical protein n=1 Tax=Janthinobacterium sp. HLX7-2 TaxID=1259331 RepID=UPI003F25EBF0